MIDTKIKEKVIRERVLGGQSIEHLSKTYGVSPGTISRWAKKYIRDNGAISPELYAQDMGKEIERLTEEVRRLRAERDILHTLILESMQRGAPGADAAYKYLEKTLEEKNN